MIYIPFYHNERELFFLDTLLSYIHTFVWDPNEPVSFVLCHQVYNHVLFFYKISEPVVEEKPKQDVKDEKPSKKEKVKDDDDTSSSEDDDKKPKISKKKLKKMNRLSVAELKQVLQELYTEF